MIPTTAPTCPCCGGDLDHHDTIEAGSAHPTERRGTVLWQVWRCASCAAGQVQDCTCEDGGIYNDRHGALSMGQGR